MKKFTDLNSILLVDDDKFTNLVHTKVIERTKLGVSVKAINNVTDAIAFLTQEKAATDQPNIIFLDINMPGLTGWDFMALYDQLDERHKANVIVVMLTTSLNPDDYQRAKLNGHIVDFLHKPLRPDMLLDVASRYFHAEDAVGE
ncbi:response regulator [Spirosoma rhododendri]|uniref:Response regulator n=1 Tax=Spirosoma rhododendri TaxID=2728024 RepID=A0A7L5DW10_9BACT|nr:response regulator [Spirosoma rhododendri]QJD80798.1 response regulator [Spirosoma rhododendri]